MLSVGAPPISWRTVLEGSGILVRWLFLSLALLAAHPAPGQNAPPGPVRAAGSEAQPVPQSPREVLEATRAEIAPLEAALRRPDLSQQQLQDLRAQLDPLAERMRTLVAELAPQLEAARGRLEQLGPRPKDGAPPEGIEVARDRAEREAALAELDETQRRARALLVQAEQLTAQVGDRRRSAFASALFDRSYSLLAPDLWLSAAGSLGRDLRALRIVSGDAASRFQRRASPVTLTLLGLAIGAAIAFHIARRNVAPLLIRRDPAAVEVDWRRRVWSGLGVLVFEGGPPIAGSFIVYQLLVAADLLPPRLYPVLGAILGGLAFLAFLRALLDATLAPDRPAWRLLPMSDAAASSTSSFVIAFGATVAIGRVLEGLNQAIAAALPLSVVTRGLVALVAALILAALLRRLARAAAAADEACLGPYIPTEPPVGGPLRLLGWALAATVVGSVLAGYIAFGSFLVTQIAWVGSLAALLYLGIKAADEFFGETLRGGGLLSTTLQSNLGLRRRSLERLGVLSAGLARVVLVLVAAMLALAPWGLESADLTSNLRAAFFGFQVGEVTISLSTIFFALLLFAAVFAVTRIVQAWLANTLLPTTELDAGLRNSIQTAAGYLGFFVAASLALSYLGLGLEKIAIVAGALSVGIGFGLQSIVNNFVSGLILLWERPIRVGDLVVIGDGEGYVRRISVRATEIETFDRSTVIIPNSNLISGVVKNRVRGDRTGRVIITVAIGRDKDPAHAAELLTAEAEKHPDILHEPPPRVVFKRIGDASLEFDLVCYVDDVTKQLRVQSDLNFSVFEKLVGEGIIPMPGPGVTKLAGLEQVESALQHIAEALAVERAKQPGQSPGRTSPGARAEPDAASS